MNTRSEKRIDRFSEKIQGVIDGSYVRAKWDLFHRDKFFTKIPMQLDHERYLVKTIDSLKELRKVLQLRYDVFIEEGLKQKKTFRVDLDAFDFRADHLVVIDKESNRIVGTYRLLCSLFGEEFYSESEFIIEKLLDEPETKLELGRACIHEQFRTGSVIALLWRGIRKYMELSNSRYLFGCASFKTTNLVQAQMLSAYFKKLGLVQPVFGVRPQATYRFKGWNALEHELTPHQEKQAFQLTPSLVRTYSKAGAVFAAEPALDLDFACIDFFTLLDGHKFDARIDQRFQKKC